ncbi:MAG TPA: hypothetical protein VFR68_08040 [Candidatus Dormibacteraeota bacterium]|nr:hypothetical protein [Candidatus Dormibacteraeota bacterium]
MARPIAQLWAAIVVFLVLGAISIVLTNALFNVVAASSKPSVTFSIVTATPSSTAR